MMEMYEAFSDIEGMFELQESLFKRLAECATDGQGHVVQWDGLEIRLRRPFERIRYGDLFKRGTGIDMSDRDGVKAAAIESGIENAASIDHWLLVNMLFEEKGETAIDPARPTFVTHFPSAISPLSRPDPDEPDLALRGSSSSPAWN